MGLLPRIQRPGSSGYGASTTAAQVTEGLDLSKKTYLITGCNSGLGEETVRVLILRGARVIALARTLKKAERIAHCTNDKVVPIACDLSEPRSIESAITSVREFQNKLDAVICNAGVMRLPQLQNKYNFELQFFTTHIGHFLLVMGLLDRLASRGRVVMLSSSAHEMTRGKGIDFDNLSGENGYSPWGSYAQSKLCNLLFARHLATQLLARELTANAVNPGVILTPLMKHMNPLIHVAGRLVSPVFMKSVAQGAATQVYVATHPSLERVSGRYFADCNEKNSSLQGDDPLLAAALWKKTEEIVAGLR